MGDGERAAELYREAWDARGNDLEASIAAHYLARVQTAATEELRLNRAALQYALAAGEAALPFLPSLHLNLGHSHESQGDRGLAKRHYADAADALDAVDQPLADSLRPTIERARRRVASRIASLTTDSPAR